MGKACTRVQAMRVPHARKHVQNARAHRVLQENAYKDARAHGENEWKGATPPLGGEKKGGKQEKRKKERRKEKERKKKKQTLLTNKKKKQTILTKTKRLKS